MKYTEVVSIIKEIKKYNEDSCGNPFPGSKDYCQIFQLMSWEKFEREVREVSSDGAIKWNKYYSWIYKRLKEQAE